MERRQDLELSERRRFLSGRACLDFTHTGGEEPWARWEILHGPSDVARWLGLILEVDDLRVTARDMPEVRSLRTAITDVARTLAAGGTPDPADLATVNRAAAAPPLVPQLVDGQIVLRPGSARAALSSLARDALDLFGSPLADRIRVCESDTCLLLFVDASRPGTRRWCSMEWCGDHAKKRTHRGGA